MSTLSIQQDAEAENILRMFKSGKPDEHETSLKALQFCEKVDSGAGIRILQAIVTFATQDFASLLSQPHNFFDSIKFRIGSASLEVELKNTLNFVFFRSITCLKIHNAEASELIKYYEAFFNQKEGKQFCESLFQRTAEIVDDLNEEQLIIILKCLGSHDIKEENLIPQLAAKALSFIDRYSVNDLIVVFKCLASFIDADQAVLQCKLPKSKNKNVKDVFTAISEKLYQKKDQLNVDNKAEIIWALDKSSAKDSQLLSLKRSVVEKFDETDPKLLPQTFLSLNNLGFDDLKFYETHLVPKLIDNWEIFTPKDIGKIAQLFSQLKLKNTTIFEKISASACKKIDEFNYRDVVKIALAFSALNIRDEVLFFKIAKRVIAIGIWDASISMLALSFAKVNIKCPEFFDLMIEKSKDLPFSSVEYHQMHAFSAFLTVIKYPKNLDQALIDKSLEVVEKSKPIISPPQIKIYKELIDILYEKGIKMGIEKRVIIKNLRKINLEYCEKVSGHCIDIAIPSLKIAIEVDGKGHYSTDSDPLGKTVYRNWLLEQLGWNLLCIRLRDLPKDTILRRKYLEQIIDNIFE